jgi:hypothetical protein
MLTRKATIKDTEMRLKQALLDLKETQDLNTRLLQEHEDSEQEIQVVIKKNSDLKRELAELHLKYTDISERCIQMEATIDSFHQCHDTHERALSRINDLEISLSDAHRALKSNELSSVADASQSLFTELSNSVSGLVGGDSSSLTISTVISPYKEIINDNNSCKPILTQTSHKKIKKYVRLNRFINKTKRLIKSKNYIKKDASLKSERVVLLNKLKSFSDIMLQTKESYDSYLGNIDEKILYLENTLKEMFKEQHKMCQNIINYQVSARHDMIDLCNYSTERYASLTEKHFSQCSCSQAKLNVNDTATPEDINRSLPQLSPGLSVFNDTNINTNLPSQFILENPNYKGLSPINIDSQKETPVYMFSDKIGQGLGHGLMQELSRKVINMCSPGLTYEKIVNKILNSTIEENSDIVVFCGDSNGIKKRHITDCTTKLLKFSDEKKCKIILCAFPYASNMSYDENRHIFNLNLYMHHLTCRHSDVFLFFDCNKFVTKFTLTRDTVYLSNSFKKRIANLLAYNLSHSVHDDRTSGRQGFSRTNLTMNLN